MSFKAKVSIDSNGVKEERSVLFIQTLLLGRTKNNIDKGTTQSNIDGYIELLDSSMTVILSCLIHQIELMVKLLFK